MMALPSALRRRRARGVVTLVIFVALAALAYCLMLGQGAVELSPAKVLSVLSGGGTAQEISIVWDLRLPVAITTLLIGAALGTAGAWTQTMTRNPLASPDFLGVSSGASLAVVAGTVLAPPAFADSIPEWWWRAGLAAIGAAAIVALLLVLSGGQTANKVVLIGFALSQLCVAAVSWLLLKADIRSVAEAQTWLAGNTGMVRWEAIPPLVLALLPFALLGAFAHRDLDLLAHDDATARSLGVNLGARRVQLLVAATGLVAVTVSVVGPIGFVALIAPHLARLVSGAPMPPPLASAAAGAALLTGCAVIAGNLGRLAPVGLVSSVIGGAVLVAIVLHQARRTRLK